MVTASWECVTPVRPPLCLSRTLGVGLGLSLVHAHVELTLAQRNEGLTYQQEKRERDSGVELVHWLSLIETG